MLTEGSAAAAPAVTNISIPAPAEIIAGLRPGHPRLLATASDFDQLKRRVVADPQLKTWHDELRREAGDLLPQPPSKYEIPDGLRLLSVSRRVLHRTQLLALGFCAPPTKDAGNSCQPTKRLASSQAPGLRRSFRS